MGCGGTQGVKEPQDQEGQQQQTNQNKVQVGEQPQQQPQQPPVQQVQQQQKKPQVAKSLWPKPTKIDLPGVTVLYPSPGQNELVDLTEKNPIKIPLYDQNFTPISDESKLAKADLFTSQQKTIIIVDVCTREGYGMIFQKNLYTQKNDNVFFVVIFPHKASRKNLVGPAFSYLVFNLLIAKIFDAKNICFVDRDEWYVRKNIWVEILQTVLKNPGVQFYPWGPETSQTLKEYATLFNDCLWCRRAYVQYPCCDGCQEQDISMGIEKTFEVLDRGKHAKMLLFESAEQPLMIPGPPISCQSKKHIYPVGPNAHALLNLLTEDFHQLKREDIKENMATGQDEFMVLVDGDGALKIENKQDTELVWNQKFVDSVPNKTTVFVLIMPTDEIEWPKLTPLINCAIENFSFNIIVTNKQADLKVLAQCVDRLIAANACWKTLQSHVATYNRLKFLFPFTSSGQCLFQTSKGPVPNLTSQRTVLNGISLSDFTTKIPNEVFFQRTKTEPFIQPSPIWVVEDENQNFQKEAQQKGQLGFTLVQHLEGIKQLADIIVPGKDEYRDRLLKFTGLTAQQLDDGFMNLKDLKDEYSQYAEAVADEEEQGEQ